MKKILAVIIVFVMIFVTAACNNNPDNGNTDNSIVTSLPDETVIQPGVEIDENQINTVGNTIWNTHNNGIVAVQGGWVYYRNSADNYYLYKARYDGTQATLLARYSASRINVVGDTVYFISGALSTDDIVAKVNTDGTGFKSIVQGYAEGLTVVGDSVYFTSGRSQYFELYKTDLSLENKVQLTENENPYDFFVENDRIYYRTFDTNDFRSISINGGEVTDISTDHSVYHNFYLDGYVYYTTKNENGIFRMKLTGEEETKIMDASCSDIFPESGYIYYRDSDYKLWRCNIDGSEINLICDYRVYSPCAINGMIFFNDISASLYCIDLDGNDVREFGNTVDTVTAIETP